MSDMSDMPDMPPPNIERIRAFSRAINITRDLHGFQPLCYPETGTVGPPPLSPGGLRARQRLALACLLTPLDLTGLPGLPGTADAAADAGGPATAGPATATAADDDAT